MTAFRKPTNTRGTEPVRSRLASSPIVTHTHNKSGFRSPNGHATKFDNVAVSPASAGTLVMA